MIGQPAREEAQVAGIVEQRPGVREAVAERVLRGLGTETGRHAGEHRGVAEELARSEQVDHAVLVQELDRPGAHDADVLDRRRPLCEDEPPLGMELDLRRVGDARDLVGGQRVEGRVGPEELGDLVHPGGS